MHRARLLMACHLMLAFLVSAFIIPHEIIMGGAVEIGILASKLLPMSAAAATYAEK